MISCRTLHSILFTLSFLCLHSMALLTTDRLPLTISPRRRRLAPSWNQEQPPSLAIVGSKKERHLVVLQMAGKKMRNNQAALAQKLALAKEQAKNEGGENGTDKVNAKEAARLSAAEIKEKNDRLRFEELLRTQASSILNDYSSDGYKNQQQEEEEIMAARSGIDRLFEGDPAPSEPFQELVSIKTENALGEAGAKRLVPWMRDSSDYLIVVCDPRMKSSELRQTARTLRSELDATLRSKLIFINADTPAENRRWMKNTSTDQAEQSSSSSSSSSSSISSASSSLTSSIDVYSDEKMEWMRAYTALGEKRWSMTMFVLANQKVQKIARDLEAVAATRVIQNAAKSMSEPRI